MDEFPWYKSSILQSQIVAFAMAAAAFFNYQFDFNLSDIVAQVFAGVGALMAIWATFSRLRKPNPNLTQAANEKEKQLVKEKKLPEHLATAGVVEAVKREGGFAKLGFLGMVAALLMVGLVGCPASNPVKPALESGKPEVIAFAIEGSYTIVQSKAADMAEDQATPENVRKVIKCVAERANPVLDELRPLAVEAEALRAQIAAGGSGVDRLAIIVRDLNADVNKVAPLVSDLVAAINGKAQGVCAS